ncbi:MAG: gamma subclass chorismate mutase AroQ [Pseudomonadota bacterium]
MVGYVWRALAVLLILAASATAQTPAPQALVDAMTERLALMEPVARYKWNAGRPIEDLAREQVVLDKVVESAGAAGVDVDFARSFFQAQIAAAKEIQQRNFDRWAANGQGKFAQVRDLNSDLRPAIIALTGRVIAELKRLPGVQATEICRSLAPPSAALAEDQAAWRLAVQPLRDLAGGCGAG